jgi:hypothetical protein
MSGSIGTAHTLRHRLSRRATLVLGAVLAWPVRAQEDIWTVRGVAVDISGTDAVAARERALAQAARQAWETLLPRVAPAERIPALKALTAAEIEALTDGLEIEDERVAPTRYAATMTVVFNADRVRDRLADPGAGGAGAPAGRVAARARYRSLAEWTELQRRLGASPAVARLVIRAIGLTEADLMVTLTQDQAGAASTLGLVGVRAEPAPDGALLLSLAPSR